MTKFNLNDESDKSASVDLVFLTSEQAKLIDRALSGVSEFGEVRLVKVKGRLRFIQKMSSEDVAPNGSKSTNNAETTQVRVGCHE